MARLASGAATDVRRSGLTMDALTVFLAPDGAAGGVRDVLRDLSAAGLVEPFLWVREAAVIAARDDGRASRGAPWPPAGWPSDADGGV